MPLPVVYVGTITANAAVATNVTTVFFFDPPTLDEVGATSTANPERVTATALAAPSDAGAVVWTGQVDWAANATGQRGLVCGVIRTGPGTIGRGQNYARSGGAARVSTSHACGLCLAKAGDYLVAQGWQSSGGNLAASGGKLRVLWLPRRGTSTRVMGGAVSAVVTATETLLSMAPSGTIGEDYGAWSAYSGSTPSRLTFPVSGAFLFSVNVSTAQNATGYRRVTVNHRNSAAALITAYVASCQPSTTTTNTRGVMAPLNATAGDYLEVSVYQTSGGNLDCFISVAAIVDLRNGIGRRAEFAMPTLALAGAGTADQFTYTNPPTVDQIGLDLSTTKRVTVPTGARLGRVLLMAEVGFAVDAVGYRHVSVRHRSSVGTIKGSSAMEELTCATIEWRNTVALIVHDLVAGDYFEVEAVNGSGALNCSGILRLVFLDGGP